MQVVVVTPEKTTLDQSCEYVALPMIDGEAGVLPGHAPMIGRLSPGKLLIRDGGKDVEFYVDGGFVQINDDMVSVLTGKSIPVAEIDVAAAREALAKAESDPADNAALMEIKRKAIAQARAQIRLAEK